MSDPNETRPAQPPPTASHNPGSSEGTFTQTRDPVAASAEADAFPAIPGYELRAKLGEGGMGVVYLARQRGLNRDVAIKTLSGATVSRATLARFWAEAEVMAEVRHPNVVQVIELGESGGRPFMAMEFVNGGSLAGRLRGGVQLPPLGAVALMEQVARGVAAAHDLGIVHRDLKPDNVLMDGETPKVADFGVAKRKSHEMTQTNAMLGTPAYMSPEQASSQSKHVGPAADVWSLGVMLYECLSGKRPFAGDTIAKLFAQIQSEEPPPLRTSTAGVPRDLRTIVSKCLSKEPELRYASAAELADDLGRWARGDPIAARPLGVSERAVRWVRRKPTAAAAWAFSALTLALSLVVLVVFGFWREAEGAKKGLEEANGRLTDEQKRTAAARDEALKLKGIADAGRVNEKQLRGAADKARDAAEAAQKGEAEARKAVEREREKLEVVEYGRTMQVAYQEWRENNVPGALALLDRTRPALRGWEWRFVHRLCHSELLTLKGHAGEVLDAAFSADERRIVTAGRDRTVRVWDARTGAELLTLKCPAPPTSAAFNPDGTRLVVVGEDGTARAFDAKTGAELLALKGHTGRVTAVSFSPDGARLVNASDDKTARVWDLRTGVELLAFKGHTESVSSASFSPDGARVVTGSEDGTARVWNAETGGSVLTIKCPQQPMCAAFSPDGKRVVTGGVFGPPQVWEASTGVELVTLKGHTSLVPTAAFGRDPDRIVTASWDRTARIWDPQTGGELLALKGHTDFVHAAAFSPTGNRVVTAGRDGTARVWDARVGPERTVIKEAGVSVMTPTTNRDRTRTVVVGDDGIARVLDAKTGAELFTLNGHTDRVLTAKFSPDGARIVTGSKDKTARVWDAKTGAELLTLRGFRFSVFMVGFSPDGTQIGAVDIEEMLMHDSRPFRDSRRPDPTRPVAPPPRPLAR